MLKSRITSLITLSLLPSELTPIPTTPQMLSILSNPNLQHLSLIGDSVPHDDDGVSSPQIQLRRLKKLHVKIACFPKAFQPHTSIDGEGYLLYY